MMYTLITVPEFVVENITQLYDEMKMRYLTAEELSEKVCVNHKKITEYEFLYSLPSRSDYNRLARYFDWQLWKN